MKRFTVIAGQLIGGRMKQRGRLLSRCSYPRPYDTIVAAHVHVHHKASHSIDKIAKRWVTAKKRLYNRYCKFYSWYLVKIGVKRERI